MTPQWVPCIKYIVTSLFPCVGYNKKIDLKTIVRIIGTERLRSVPIKYRSANSLFSICLKRAMLFAVITSPTAAN